MSTDDKQGAAKINWTAGSHGDAIPDARESNFYVARAGTKEARLLWSREDGWELIIHEYTKMPVLADVSGMEVQEAVDAASALLMEHLQRGGFPPTESERVQPKAAPPA